MEWLVYNFDTNQYTSGRVIPLDKYCNGVTIKNTGTSDLVFQKEILSAGKSKAIGGNYGEILISRIQISFQDPAVPPPGYVRADQATVTEKFYTPQIKVTQPPC